MSATDHADAADQEGFEEDEDDSPGLWISFGTALRLIVGWFCVAIGVLNLLVELDQSSRQPDGAYLTFHVVLLIGGVVLLALAFINPRPGLLGYGAGAAVAMVGMLASAIPATSTICCMTAFALRHGFPFTFMARHNVVDRWHVDSQHVLADLLFWGYAGMFGLIAVSLFRREPDDDETAEPAGERLYIEHPREPDQRTVGPLP